MVRLKKFDVVAGYEEAYHRIFKVGFGKDGSIFAFFPGFVSTSGILCRVAMPGGMSSAQLSLKENGMATNHLVKFSHHPDGQAHFSQDGRIRTEIKRRSVPLAEQWGHIFTVQVQNLDAFPMYRSNRNQHITFSVSGAVCSLKIVVRRFPKSDWGRSGKANRGTPPKAMNLEEGVVTGQFACPPSGYRYDDHFLFLSITELPILSTEGAPHLKFLGGFDPGNISLDHSKETEFLAAAYPCSNPAALAEAIGTVDLNQRTDQQTK